MRALFIIHCQDPVYGASRSVSAVIRNLDADIDIIFPFKIKKDGRITPEQIKRYYGNCVRNIWYLPQPAKLTILESFHVPIADKIKCIAKDILYFMLKPYYYRILKKGKYDFIHLNSVTLYPMLDSRYPMFLHVRETIRKTLPFEHRKFTQKAARAHGVLFINDSTKKVFPKIDVPQIVLINPIDQINVGKVNLQKAQQYFNLDRTKTVYAIIGNVIQCKGVLFVARAFQKAALENAILLIVGQDSAHRKYERQVQEFAAQNPCIRVLGEIENTDVVYRITDYVVRGDETIGLGRTVFEGLYSGCGAVLQYQTQEDRVDSGIPEEMFKKVFFYKLQDEESLISAFRESQNKKMVSRRYESNVSKYLDAFLKFILKNR